MKTKWCLFLTCAVYLSASSKAVENTKLLFVQILFRHGDRSPIELYPTDPNPATFWQEGLGKLTMVGRKQQYALGEYLRDRYQDFITSSPLEINVTSSGIDRCLKSAEANVAAFFAPSAEWSFERRLNWQPIPVYYIPKHIDKYLETDSICPRASEEEKRVLSSPEGRKLLTEHKEMLDALTNYSGKPLSSGRAASDLRDVLTIEKNYNLIFPSWAEPYWDELNTVADLSFYWSYNSPLLQRLRAGPLIQKIIENMQKKINDDLPELKVHVYCSHDTKIVAILEALNLFNMKQPPYCATLLFELHENKDGAKMVRLLYQNSSNPEDEIQDPHVLVLDGCSEFCPLAYFIDVTRSLIPEDWDKECQLDRSGLQKVKEQQIPLGWFLFLVAIIIIQMITCALLIMHYRRQDKYPVDVFRMNRS